MQVDVREEKIRELKVVAETSRENEAKQTAVASQLRAQLVEFEAHAGSIEGVDRLLLIVFILLDFRLQLWFCRCGQQERSGHRSVAASNSRATREDSAS